MPKRSRNSPFQLHETYPTIFFTRQRHETRTKSSSSENLYEYIFTLNTRGNIPQATQSKIHLRDGKPDCISTSQQRFKCSQIVTLNILIALIKRLVRM
jgi:hypothetical protein